MATAAVLPDPEPLPRPPAVAEGDRARGPGRAEALVESYRRLAQVFHHVLSEQSLDALLERIADTLAELVPHDSLTIYEADDRERRLRPVHARDPYAEEILSTTIPYGEGITGWAVEQRQPVLTNQAQLDPRVAVIPGTPADDPEALVCVPLVSRGALKGSLNIYRLGERAAFDEEEFELAKWFGDAAALAIDNAQIRARLEHQAQTDSLTELYNHRTFHERLRAELARAARAGDMVALLMLDIDDFKRVNDVLGHAEGDRLLIHLADVLRSTVRSSDIVCRVGGEEFAVILPSCDERDALGLARRVREKLEAKPVEIFGEITVSVGVSLGPEHASSARELVACAEAAMMMAKAQGKDRIVVFSDGDGERPAGSPPVRDVRSIAHLKMLQSLARKLGALTDVSEIADAILDELRVLVEFQTGSVHVVDGRRLIGVAVRGVDDMELDPSEFSADLGVGLVGHVVETGTSELVPNLKQNPHYRHPAGYHDLEESAISVPLRHGNVISGAVTVTKLGIGQFDEDDLRLLEVVSGHAAVSLENARLYESLRREAQNAKAWLEFTDAVSEANSVEEIGREVVTRIASVLGLARSSLWLEERESGTYRCAAAHGYEGKAAAEAILLKRPGRGAVAPVLDGRKTPFVLGPEDVRHHFFDDDPELDLATTGIAPLPTGYGVRGWIAVRSPQDDPTYFTAERLRLLEGLAFRASVAMQRALLYRAQQESAETASSLLEFARQLATAADYSELTARTVELAARMLGSHRAVLWIEHGNDECRLEAAWREDGRPPVNAIGTSFPIGSARALLDRTQPFLLEPGKTSFIEQLPKIDETVAMAPLSLGGGRIGGLGVAMSHLDDRRFRLLAGMAHQASLALAARRA